MRKLLSLFAFVVFLTACTQAEANLVRRTQRTKVMSSRPAVSSSSSSSVTPVPLTQYKIPILVYHHVRPQQGWAKSTWSWKMTVTPETFEKQMKWLTEHHYTGVDLDTFVQIVRGEIQGPVKPVVITFDDNNLNAYDAGLPILKKYNQKAVFYIITNKLKNKDTIDEERIRNLVAEGMSIQSHTVSHPVLTQVDNARLDAELLESKKTLEALMGKPVLHLAYPGTTHNQRVRDRAKALGYVTATIMDPRPVTEKDDFMKLPRIMMTDDTNLEKVLP
jgi:peptidoglycan/xylan/chitin deacetylase (PgdA/CDA1 family)